MDRVLAFYAGEFPENERAYVACMRLLVEHSAASGAAARLEAVPFNCFGFGLFPSGRSCDSDSPCLTLWFDDPSPLYWVQVRRRWDRDILICDQSHGPEQAWSDAAAALPRLLAEAARSPDRGRRLPIEWLAQISPITNFVTSSNEQDT